MEQKRKEETTGSTRRRSSSKKALLNQPGMETETENDYILKNHRDNGENDDVIDDDVNNDIDIDIDKDDDDGGEEVEEVEKGAVVPNTMADEVVDASIPLRLEWQSPPSLMLDGEDLVGIIVDLRDRLGLMERTAGKLEETNWAEKEWFQYLCKEIQSQTLPSQRESSLVKTQCDSLQKQVDVLSNTVMKLQFASMSTRTMEKNEEANKNTSGRRQSLSDEALQPIFEAIRGVQEENAMIRVISMDAAQRVESAIKESKHDIALLRGLTSQNNDSLKKFIDATSQDMNKFITSKQMETIQLKSAADRRQEGVKLMLELSRLSRKLTKQLTDDAEVFSLKCEEIERSTSRSLDTIRSQMSEMEEKMHQCIADQATSQLSETSLKEMIASLQVQMESNDNGSSIIVDEQLSKLRATQDSLLEQLLHCQRGMETSKVEFVKLANDASATQEEVTKVSTDVQGLWTSLKAVQQTMDSSNEKNQMKFISVDDSTRKMDQKLMLLQNEMNTMLEANMGSFEEINNRVDQVEKSVKEDLLAQCTVQLDEMKHQMKNHTTRLGEEIKGLASKHTDFAKYVDATLSSSQDQLKKMVDEFEHSKEMNQMAYTKSEEKLRKLQTDLDLNVATLRAEVQSIEHDMDDLQEETKTCVLSQSSTAEKQTNLSTAMVTLDSTLREAMQSCVTTLTSQMQQEALRTEALYISFQDKQEQFARSVASTSIQKMTMSAIAAEIDILVDKLAAECVVFEKASTPSGQIKSTTELREKAKFLVIKSCQCAAEYLVAKTEFETLKSHGVESSVGVGAKVYSVEALIAQMSHEILYEVNQLKHRLLKRITDKSSTEDHDALALGRRSFFIEVSMNCLLASIARRLGFTKGLTHFNAQEDGVGAERPLLVTQSLIPSKKTSSTSHAQVVNTLSTKEDGALYAGGLDNNSGTRPIHFPANSSPYVYRGGFKLPRTSLNPGKATSSASDSQHHHNPTPSGWASSSNGEEDGEDLDGEDLDGERSKSQISGRSNSATHSALSTPPSSLSNNKTHEKLPYIS